MGKIILNEKSYIDFSVNKYTLKVFNSYNKEGEPCYDNIKYHSTPFILLEGSKKPINEFIDSLVAKINVPKNKEWKIVIHPHKISRDSLTSAQLNIEPDCYPLNLNGAIWTIAQKFIPDLEYTPESYMKAVVDALNHIDISWKYEQKNN